MATIHEVAARAGVSAGTVSRYLNGYAVKPVNAKKIDNAVVELNYRENFLARSLRINKTMSVGVLIHSMKSQFASSIIAAMESEIEKHDYAMVLCGFKNDRDSYIKQMSTLIDRKVDGLFIIEGNEEWTPDDLLEDISIPVIAINTPLEASNIDSYVTDDAWSTECIMRAIIEKSHKNVGIIIGKEDDYTSKQRLAGINNALNNSNISRDDIKIYIGDYTDGFGYKYTSDLIEQGCRCVFVTNHNMGNGALQAIHEHGFTIGKDFSFATYDYLTSTPVFYPRINSVCPNIKELGTRTAREMMNAIDTHQTFHGKRYVVENIIKWNDSIIDLNK